MTLSPLKPLLVCPLSHSSPYFLDSLVHYTDQAPSTRGWLLYSPPSPTWDAWFAFSGLLDSSMVCHSPVLIP